MFNHLHAPLEGKCLQVAYLQEDPYWMITKRGRRLQEIWFAAYYCGGMFKKILSQGEALFHT